MLALKSKIATLAIALFCLISVKAVAGTVLVEYFYQPNCEECDQITEFIMPPLKEDYGKVISLKKYPLNDKKNFLLLISILDKLKDSSNARVYMVLNRKRALSGYPAIEKELFQQVEKLSGADGESADSVTASEDSVHSVGNKLKLGTVIVAGLLDGINPCVFSTLVFFMSLLAVAKIRGERLIAVGIVYCLACFVTYLLLGFGLFKVIQSLSGFSAFKHVLNWGMAAVLVLFAALSFRDVWVYWKSDGDAHKVVLQLPDKIKKAIHGIMRRELKNRYLLGGALIIGALVTLLESVCTGQVYVPTLVLLSNEAGVFSKWFGLLLLYNLMFIIPLLAVFGLMFSGISVMKAVKLTRKNLIIGKILLGIFFLALAILMLWI